MEPITETRLRRAAEGAVARGHGIAALLFGSRARGTAGPLSDWDVCVVTEEDPGDFDAIVRRERALEAEDEIWDTGKVERVWVHRARFDRGAPIGSLEAAVAREGRALAGEASVATNARIVPFEAGTVLSNMNRATSHLQQAVGATRSQTRRTDANLRASAVIDLVTSSIAGAKAVERALRTLTDTVPGSNEPSAAGRTALESTLAHAIDKRIEELKDPAQAARRAEWENDPGEPYEQTAERFVRALEADLWTRHGLVDGAGPWAGLMHHPRRGELAESIRRSTMEYAVTNAQEWTLMPFEYPDERVHDAMRQWVEGYGALREAHL